MPAVYQRAAARRDLVDHFVHLAMVFYLPRADGVSIVRVLHAARDWWGLLGIDP